jgi:hypothetical protein
MAIVSSSYQTWRSSGDTTFQRSTIPSASRPPRISLAISLTTDPPADRRRLAVGPVGPVAAGRSGGLPWRRLARDSDRCRPDRARSRPSRGSRRRCGPIRSGAPAGGRRVGPGPSSSRTTRTRSAARRRLRPSMKWAASCRKTNSEVNTPTAPTSAALYLDERAARVARRHHEPRPAQRRDPFIQHQPFTWRRRSGAAGRANP